MVPPTRKMVSETTRAPRRRQAEAIRSPWEETPGEVLPPAVDDLGTLGAAGISVTVPTDLRVVAAEVDEEDERPDG